MKIISSRDDFQLLNFFIFGENVFSREDFQLLILLVEIVSFRHDFSFLANWKDYFFFFLKKGHKSSF